MVVLPNPYVILAFTEGGMILKCFKYPNGMLLLFSMLSSTAFAQQEYSIQLLPQTYRNVQETVVLSPPEVNQVVVPAQFNSVTGVIVTAEAHCEGESLVPKSLTIVVEAAHSGIEYYPAKYDTITENVTVRPGTAEWWQTETGAFEYFATEPDIRQVVKRIETKPSTERRIDIPARTRDISVRVRAADAIPLSDCARIIPAQTQVISRRVITEPAQVRTISIPAKNATITRRVSNAQTLTITEESGAFRETLAVDGIMPPNPFPGTLYKPEIENNNCVLWKSFSKDNATVEKGRFPWPPPNPSTESTLPDTMFAGVETLGDMNKLLAKALDAMGYQDRRRKYYPVPHGFALLTEIEQIDDTGMPLSGNARWTDDIYVIDPPSILGWLKALVTKATGRFRVFALIVTSEDVNTEAEFTDRELALDWLNSGTGALNRDRAACQFTAAHRVTALVYEFEHPEREKPYLVSNTRINHIAGSGLRTQLINAGATP